MSSIVNGNAVCLLSNRPDLEVHALAFLQAAKDLKQIARLRIPVRTEHPHQALG